VRSTKDRSTSSYGFAIGRKKKGKLVLLYLPLSSMNQAVYEC